MKYNTVALAFLFLSDALAQPHMHQHQRHHEKRDVVWTTEWEIVTETLSITATIWVDGDATPVPPTLTSTTTSHVPTTSTTSTSATPAEFHESPTTPSPQAPSTSTSVAPYVPPTPSTSSVYVQAAAPTSTYVAPVVDSVTSPAYVAPTTPATPTTTEAAYVAPVATSAAPAQATTAPSSSSSGSSSGGVCSSTSQCEGDLTFYTAGLGACGWPTDGDTEMVIALPHVLMGTQSNGNPYCGKMVTVMHNGQSIIAKVVDKCTGCDNYSIDLSNLAFSSLGIDFNQGRTTGTWYFND